MANVEYRSEEATPQKKGSFVSIIAVIAVLVLIAGTTLAYLTTTTNTESNVFTTGNISAKLVEAQWVASGETIAENFVPGVIAGKDPLIENTSKPATDISGGILIKFLKPQTLDVDNKVLTWTAMTDADVAKLLTGVGINTGTAATIQAGLLTHADWGSRIDTSANVTALIEGQQVFAYSKAIGTLTPSAAIFEQVGILSTAGNDAWTSSDPVTIDNFMTWLNTPLAAGGLQGHFQIEVQGAAVQSEGIDQAEANKVILELLGYTTL